jgi:hypothetical protein
MLTRLPPRDDRPIHEISDPKKFRSVMRSRPQQRVKVIIQGASEHPTRPGQEGPWWDIEEFWEGLYSEELPIPSAAYLRAAGLRAGAAFARSVVRGAI